MLTLFALPACMCTQVPLISVDVSKMVGIKTILGEPEEVKPLVAGAGGFATVTFADGVIHPTDTPNLFFGIASKAAAKTKAKAKPKGKAKAKGKGKGRGQRARGSAEAAGSEDGEVGEEADPGSDEAEEQPAVPLAEVGGDADELQEPPEKMARQDSVFYM
jgi:hypothetical protein